MAAKRRILSLVATHETMLPQPSATASLVSSASVLRSTATGSPARLQPAKPSIPLTDCQPRKRQYKGKAAAAAVEEAIHFVEMNQHVASAQAAAYGYRTKAITDRFEALDSDLHVEGAALQVLAEGFAARSDVTVEAMCDAPGRLNEICAEVDDQVLAIDDVRREYAWATQAPGMGDGVQMSFAAQRVVSDQHKAMRLASQVAENLREFPFKRSKSVTGNRES